ncbi:MAG: glycosyltransferase [Candidatus Hodarchaeota archaeon]
MKILLINTFHYHRGGDCTYTFALGDLLKSKGHDVYYWAMRHPKNYNYEYDNYFVDYIDYNELNEKRTASNAIKAISRCIYSFHARRKLGELIEYIRPDVAHLQSILEYLTPSIIDELKSRNIPVVWTLHHYRLLCPDWHFFRHDKVCEQCKKYRYYRCIINKCKKKSLAASFLASVESYSYKLFSIEKKVDCFIAPSKFSYEKFIEYGWPKKKFCHFYYHLFPFSNLSVEKGKKEDYGLYLGGLFSWKGVDTLIEACQWIGGFQIRILGDGPIRDKLEKRVEALALKNIRFEGYKRRGELEDILGKGSFLVIPSRWYENCPYVIMEAQSYGVPVIGSDIGGIKNLVNDQEDGLLFEVGNPRDLAAKIRCVIENPKKSRDLGLKARAKAEKEYSPELHYRRILDIYERIMQ